MSGSTGHVLSGGDLILWIEDGTVMLKTCDPNGEPVALTAEEATTLSRLLLELAETMTE